MSDPSAFGFGKFVPGFDFLQNLAKSASQATPAATPVPGMSNWVAPTLSVEDIDKRIQELKAVQFWLEQNGTALKAAIQALEVQKMTLSTLQSMNVNMADLAKAFTARTPDTPASAATASAPATPPAPEAAPQPAPAAAPPTPPAGEAKRPRRKASSTAPESAVSGAVDPMAWWGSLTEQFQNIASAAMKDVAAEALKAKAATPAAPAQAPQGQAKPSAKAPARKTSRKPAAKGGTAKTARPSARQRAG